MSNYLELKSLIEFCENNIGYDEQQDMITIAVDKYLFNECKSQINDVFKKAEHYDDIKGGTRFIAKVLKERYIYYSPKMLKVTVLNCVCLDNGKFGFHILFDDATRKIISIADYKTYWWLKEDRSE